MLKYEGKIMYSRILTLVINWNGQNCHKHQDPLSMLDAYLVPKTWNTPVLKLHINHTSMVILLGSRRLSWLNGWKAEETGEKLIWSARVTEGGNKSQCTYNVTLRCVYKTNAAVRKQFKSYICVCVCACVRVALLIQHAICCHTAICGPYGATIFFFKLPHKWKDFNIKCVFWVSLHFSG